MPPTSLERPGVRVVAPPSYDVRETRARRVRALPGEPGYGATVGKDSLVSALRESGLEQLQSVELTPRRTRGLDAGDAAGGTATIDVDVAADEDAVVLMARDGVYSWHLPTAARERTRSIEPTPRTAHFEIPLAPERSARPGPSPSERPRTRGLLGDLVRGAAQAIVFRFVAPAIVGAAIERMEAHVRPGLVHLAGPDLADWRPIGSVTDLGLPTDRPVRVLLFVHGTFSSTVGGFGALALQEDGRGFLRTAIGAYDAVIGFDHRTLSLDPRANARDLLERLSEHHSDHPMVLDIITHSRGGLTTRSFVEYELPQSSWRGEVDTIVFVAATNGGTHLADPARWHDLVDLYTNLAVAGAGALAALPGGAAVGAVVAGVIKGVGALVKYLVAYSGDTDGVPGLAAMVPDGPFVTGINERQPGEPMPGCSWYVVSSNFHVSLFDGSNHPPEFPRELALRLGEGFVDGLFKGDNDLVVDTASMSAIELPEGGGYVKDALALGSNDEVYHTNYFAQPRVLEAIAGWLAGPLGLGAGGAPEASERDRELPMAPPPMAPPPPSRRAAEPPMAPPPRSRRAAEPPVVAAEPPMAPPPRSRRAAEPPGGVSSPTCLTDARLAAEMPSLVAARKPFEVRVILSRKEIQFSPDAAVDRVDVRVDASRPLTVHVVGKSNAEVVGADTDVFGLPFGGGESELAFTVKALAKGPVAVHAIVRQGWVPLATLTLAATAVSAAALGVVDRPAHVEVHPGIDAPELEGLPCLDIIESSRPDGTVVYKYALRVEPGAEAVAFESAPLSHRDEVMADFVEQVQELVIDDLTAGQRQRRLQDIGTKLFDLLFPEEMQGYLWAHRDRIGNLLVYADEPYVPWEIVHLKPPTGNREKRTRFLAEGGLVRWRLGGFPPKEIRVRHGHARSLIPDYRDRAYQLTETALERDYLQRTFEATPLRATPDGVVAALRSGRFDLLHFAGHGVADPERISRARVLLQGRKRAGVVEPQYLTSIEVSENAKWTGRGGGPLVVLNACQTGRSGFLLSTAGGFADAFLDAGASAFISCLWSVGDQPSRTFVEKLYDELLAGTPMALATARARQEARRLGDATWLAYVVYARPDAVLVH